MSDYTTEEKRRVLLFVLQNPLRSDEPDWSEIGAELNREPEQVRNAYVLWKMESEKTEQLQQEVADGNSQVQVYQQEILTIDPESSLANQDQFFTLDGYEGEIVTSEDLEHLFCSEIVADLDIDGQEALFFRKRKHEETDETDSSYLKSLEQYSQIVLEMKREKHKKVMEMLAIKIEQGRELHEEKMEILREKRRCLQRQLHDLDTAICEKKKLKKFKSSHF